MRGLKSNSTLRRCDKVVDGWNVVSAITLLEDNAPLTDFSASVISPVTSIRLLSITAESAGRLSETRCMLLTRPSPDLIPSYNVLH